MSKANPGRILFTAFYVNMCEACRPTDIRRRFHSDNSTRRRGVHRMKLSYPRPDIRERVSPATYKFRFAKLRCRADVLFRSLNRSFIIFYHHRCSNGFFCINMITKVVTSVTSSNKTIKPVYNIFTDSKLIYFLFIKI